MIRGSCLCGAVRFELAGRPQFINHCHCSMCRKAHGAAFGSFLHSDGGGFRWTSGEEQVRNYPSSPGNMRAFCTVCGSNLPVIEDEGRHVMIPAGSLDDDPGVRPVVHIHTASKAPWHEIGDDGLPRFGEFPPDEFWVPFESGAGAAPETFRRAVPEDVPACLILRGQTRENAIPVERLAAVGITEQSWSDDVRTDALTGYVCVDDGRIVGYCYGDKASGEVVVLALLPAWEERGIGRRLLELMVEHLAALGHRRLFLGCNADPATRSHGFYRHLGWVSTGSFDRAGDEVLELFPQPRGVSLADQPAGEKA